MLSLNSSTSLSCIWHPRSRHGPKIRQDDVGAAEQKIGFLRAFTFAVDAAMRLEPKVLLEMLMGCCRDLDTIRQAVRLHSTGDVHCITPDVIDEFVGPYDPGYHVARMNTDAHLQGNRQLAVHPLDRRDHRQRYIGNRMGVVRSRLGQAASHHVGISERLDLLDPEVER